MTISDRTLLGAALGVLDPGDALALDEALGPSEHLRQSGLGALAGIPVPNALPGPTLSRGSSGVLSAPDRPLRLGERLSFVLCWPGLPEDARCAVFRRVNGERCRVYPKTETWTPLSRFRQRDGLPLLELVVEPPTGPQALDVILVSGDLSERPWPDDSPHWEALHRRYREGQGYGITVDIYIS